MTDFEETFVVSSIHEHVAKKGLWAGSLEPISIPNLVGLNESNQIVDITRNHTPALLKSIDEIIVNAVDHCKGCEKNIPSKRVNTIEVTFNSTTGQISVYNNGPGIPITKDKNNVYLIESAFSQFLAGTNIDKPVDSIKGGINGLGAKIANTHSMEFIVETVSNKQKYVQTFLNRLSVINSPVITKTTELEHTLITFTPAYKALHYNDPLLLEDLDKWLKLRMCQTAAYLGNKVTVSYNGTRCETTDVTSLASLVIADPDTEKVFNTIAKSTNGHCLNIAIIYGKKSKKKNSIKNMTIVNGVVSNTGSHINYIKNTIKATLDTKVSRLKGSVIEKRDISANTKLIVCGAIPGIDWSGQNKSELQVSNKVLETYKIPPTFVNLICTELIGIVNEKPTKEVKIEHDKYIKAKNITNKQLKKNCLLLAAEGDSAITLLRTGLTQKCNKKHSGSFVPSFDWIGIISLQGVVINAAKELTEHVTSEGSIIIKSDKLKNNKRLNMLADAFGLKYEYKYEKQEEINSLNYGKLILCTDQDLDGTGKICSLVLVWVYTFWPKLIEHKKIGKLMTPVIRIYNKSKVEKEFHYEQELENCKEYQQYIKSKYIIKYYKGLATHDSNEATSMFQLMNFNKNVYLYTLDDAANELFNIYFGTDPDLRKKILVTPVKHLTYEESLDLKQKQEIPVGRVQLDIDTKLYKNEAISRQLPHAIDGLNPARRKVLMASIIRFSSDAKEVKVFQLGGYVADKMLYHHGGDSLNKTIITMAQNFKGARLYPYLIGVGQFGDRHGSKAGSPRYISVKLNPIVKEIFPSEDRWLLKFTFDEGIRAEPEYFVPVIPMAVLESYQIVTEGWNHKTFYRTLDSVLPVIKDYIKGDELLIKTCDNLHKTKDISCIPKELLNRYDLKTISDARLYKDSEHSFGDYTYDSEKNTIHITELPLGVFTQNYLESVSKSNYVDTVEDYSSTNEIDITIYLKPDSIKSINANFGSSEIDPIEDCFNLKTSLKPKLNYYSCDKAVLEFKDNYLADILYWAPVRKDLYRERLIRMEIILRLIILREKEIIRYIKMSNKINLSSIEDDPTAIAILKQNNFPGINSSLLNSPGYTSNDKLESEIMNDDFDYILDLKERDLTKSAVARREKAIEKYLNEYSTVEKYLKEKPWAGSTLWLKEIDDVCKKLQGF